ncbi:MAG: hypothetical protein HYX78_11015 [Armatimonadetes bacterium]|nr:hypothetical protein [Armatimonadota bacterium]
MKYATIFAALGAMWRGSQTQTAIESPEARSSESGGENDWMQLDEMLYKDLLYTTNALFIGEQIFPYWEAVYAILSGALLTAYFAATAIKPVPKLVLCIVGILFSINWRRLVERNRLFANAREGRMKIICKLLQRQVDFGRTVMVVPDDRKQPIAITKFTIFQLSEDQKKYLDSHCNWWSGMSTWVLRIAVPKYLMCIWILLAAYAVYAVLIALSVVPTVSWLHELI